MITLDNLTFAQDFARRLNYLVRDYPKDMFALKDEMLPTGTETGAMALWRMFSLLCVEAEASDPCLIVPHLGETMIRGIHAMTVTDYNELRVRRQGDPESPMPDPDPLGPQLSNESFSRELARRVNMLYGEYPEWVLNFLAHQISVSHEIKEEISSELGVSLETAPIGLAVLMSLVCSADPGSDPWGIAPVDEIGERVVREISHHKAEHAIAEAMSGVLVEQARDAVKH